ncbi:amino acid ABC transporter permease [Ilumatobacter coccineus]|jgi:general L-amino acid transport system permease protein|uniref:Amino acid ABC transporter permease protein n=1 Tax=Ilumatobacter coccineus (strain NBRC 103263 / KCTC 29153 / YM16-304) TaxID=1313172 RepID=A0A6C7EF29_ILUCY|nr:ABC transporter permease subunit [Ilumatobacter coccineus]BAN03228.1 amino acid ABC transporter permease protein [Ilumatobacter coccineus YM16-304]
MTASPAATPPGGSTPSSPTKPPFWRNVRTLRIIAQVLTLGIVVGLIYVLQNNLLNNLNRLGISTDFDFLSSEAKFTVRDSGFTADQSVLRMILIGVQNTAAAAFVGIAVALVLGTLIGIGRLSSNWVLRKLATLYVETFRNIPPLVIIIFVGVALFTAGPLPLFTPTNPPGELQIPGTDSNFLIYSNTRLGFPSLMNDDNAGTFWIVMLIALVIAAIVWRWRTKVNELTGADHHRVLYSLGTLLGIGLIAYIALGGPVDFSFPAVSESGRKIDGGLATNDGYVALTLALALYTASHIAEIVRGSILAVAKGQNEAANALALSGFQRYRFVVLPQAARIALPSIINQFLNLTKNTSLATVVAYPEITSLTQSLIGNDQPAPQMILILMLLYLSFSLTISFILNIVNRRFQLEGRT